MVDGRRGGSDPLPLLVGTDGESRTCPNDDGHARRSAENERSKK